MSLVVGIAGGSGSGKSTLVDQLANACPQRIAVLSQDYYYHSQSENQVDFDQPQAIDFDRLAGDIAALKAGEAVSAPVYDFSTHRRLEQTQLIEPAPVVIVEGILIFAAEEVRSLFDLRIFVHVDDDLRLLRRLKRDVLQRGRSHESVIEQYQQSVRPAHVQHVAASMARADLILTGADDSLNRLVAFIAGLQQM